MLVVVAASPPPAAPPVLPLLLTIVVPALFVEEAVLAALGTRGYDTVALDADTAVLRTLARVAVVAVVFPGAAALAPRRERTEEAVVVAMPIALEGGGARFPVRVRVEVAKADFSVPLP